MDLVLLAALKGPRRLRDPHSRRMRAHRTNRPSRLEARARPTVQAQASVPLLANHIPFKRPIERCSLAVFFRRCRAILSLWYPLLPVRQVACLPL